MRVCECLCVSIWVCACVYVYACMCVCMCASVCMYVCVHVCVFANVRACLVQVLSECACMHLCPYTRLSVCAGCVYVCVRVRLSLSVLTPPLRVGVLVGRGSGAATGRGRVPWHGIGRAFCLCLPPCRLCLRLCLRLCCCCWPLCVYMDVCAMYPDQPGRRTCMRGVRRPCPICHRPRRVIRMNVWLRQWIVSISRRCTDATN
jgi:hypothetical protein